jgi:A/G-specific adenine glycosylase
MSSQTRVSRVAGYWERWIERWPTVEALAAAPLAGVLALWQGLGYPRRARDLHRAARIVAADGWPEDLRALPGVGPYVADAIRCFALEQPVLPRDVNVNRVLRRRFAAGLDTSPDPWRAGQALMEFGQRVCTTRPRCGECPVPEGCRGPDADAGAPRRRQPRYVGSLRQSRGRLLARVLAEGTVGLGQAELPIARSLAGDGLARLSGTTLRPPG